MICIGESSFADCINLRKVILPNTLRYIEDYAFYHCYSLCEVNIPDSVVSIGKDAFPCGSITMNDNSLHNLYEKSETVFVPAESWKSSVTSSGKRVG